MESIRLLKTFNGQNPTPNAASQSAHVKMPKGSNSLFSGNGRKAIQGNLTKALPRLKLKIVRLITLKKGQNMVLERPLRQGGLLRKVFLIDRSKTRVLNENKGVTMTFEVKTLNMNLRSGLLRLSSSLCL